MSRPLTKLLNELHTANSLRAWSVIITFFGDSVTPRGGAVSATTIQNLMSSLDIGAGTVRTALSRLAKDGWVVREKVGRNSYYQLSDSGTAIFTTAETMIYAGSDSAEETGKQSWLIAIKPPTQTTDPAIYQQAHKLNKDCYLFAQIDPEHQKEQQQQLLKSNALLSPVTADNIPQWVIDQIATPDLADKYHQLIKRITALTKNPPRDPLTSLAARTLLIHEWRRLLLKSNRQYNELLPASWPHEHCLKSVARLYHLLSPAAEQWLDQKAFGPQGPLLTSDFDTRNRFCPISFNQAEQNT